MQPGVERNIDVSALGPPEPLVLTLAAVEQLQPGEFLRMHHRMKPCHLYDELDRRGYSHDTRRTADGMCEVFIWRQGDVVAAAAAREAAQSLAAWPAN
ncbi:MAG: hypothetical protein Kow0096_22670 [Thiohalomonadaceae bacterium]